ncbi:hypothetical protein TMatcc_007572 [Talaromyces marneffei ATCC 18224]
MSNRYEESNGPPLASGWNWALKIGRDFRLTLVASIVEVDKVRLPVVRQSICIYGIAVVLTGDVAATSGKVESGNVVSTVTILELDSTGTGSESKQLMSHANSHNRDLRSLHQLSQIVDSLLAVSWVTGSVGDENTVKVVSHLVDGVVKWEDSDTGTTAHKTAENVLLDTAVDESNVTLRVGSTDVERSLGADLTD